MVFLSKCLENSISCVCFISKRKKEKRKEKINLSIFELESKYDNLEYEDEKLIWNLIIK